MVYLGYVTFYNQSSGFQSTDVSVGFVLRLLLLTLLPLYIIVADLRRYFKGVKSFGWGEHGDSTVLSVGRLSLHRNVGASGVLIRFLMTLITFVIGVQSSIWILLLSMYLLFTTLGRFCVVLYLFERTGLNRKEKTARDLEDST